MTIQHLPPPDNKITVVFFTSPIPSHPSANIFFNTYGSVNIRLPESRKLVLADGVRPEQEDRRADYEGYVGRLSEYETATSEYELFYWPEHLHQSGMFRRVVDDIHTPYVLLMEHDTPLIGEIPWWAIIEFMENHKAHSVRFLHEDSVHPEWDHLYDSMVVDTASMERFQWTRQYSFRPHLARTDWYRNLMKDYFNRDSRTFIEDVLYSRGESGKLGNMAVYLPMGGAKRSTHLDGRSDDPKYPQWDAVRGITL